MRAAFGAVVVIFVAVSFALAGAAVVNVFDGLVADIRAALAYAPLRLSGSPGHDGSMETGSLELIIVDGPPTGAARGIQIAIFAMLLGGVPAAVFAMVLARRSEARHKRWPGRWAQAFLGGFIFQLGSLFFTSICVLMLALDVGSPADQVFLIIESGLLITIACSIGGLRAWRRLRASVTLEPDARIT